MESYFLSNLSKKIEEREFSICKSDENVSSIYEREGPHEKGQKDQEGIKK